MEFSLRVGVGVGVRGVGARWDVPSFHFSRHVGVKRPLYSTGLHNMGISITIVTYPGKRVVDGLRQPPRDGVGGQYTQKDGELVIVYAWGGACLL